MQYRVFLKKVLKVHKKTHHVGVYCGFGLALASWFEIKDLIGMDFLQNFIARYTKGYLIGVTYPISFPYLWYVNSKKEQPSSSVRNEMDGWHRNDKEGEK